MALGLLVVLASCSGGERAPVAGGGATGGTSGGVSSVAATDTGRVAAATPRPPSPPFGVTSSADSVADREARAALPPLLASALDVDRSLTDRAIAGTPGAECMVQSQTSGTEERRRLHIRLPDRSSLVLFARVDTAERAVRRVEFMRNPVGEEQIAMTLDGEGDVATVIRWPDRGHGRAQSAVHPGGGPLPRVLRSFARRLWTLTCPAHGPAA